MTWSTHRALTLTRSLLLAASCMSIGLAGLPANAGAADHAAPECIVPAKPGGGMDLTCKLTQKGLQIADPHCRLAHQLSTGWHRRRGMKYGGLATASPNRTR